MLLYRLSLLQKVKIVTHWKWPYKRKWKRILVHIQLYIYVYYARIAVIGAAKHIPLPILENVHKLFYTVLASSASSVHNCTCCSGIKIKTGKLFSRKSAYFKFKWLKTRGGLRGWPGAVLSGLCCICWYMYLASTSLIKIDKLSSVTVILCPSRKPLRAFLTARLHLQNLMLLRKNPFPIFLLQNVLYLILSSFLDGTLTLVLPRSRFVPLSDIINCGRLRREINRQSA